MDSTSANPIPHSNPNSKFLSREKVIRRRNLRLKNLYRVYRRHYWSLIEEIRVRHRDYYWEFGKSPYEGDQDDNRCERVKCGASGCKSKAMALTTFCHQHILFDKKQTLYKPCMFDTKSSSSGKFKCGKPVLRATEPCLCPMHIQKIQKQMIQGLRRAGVNSSIKAAPKFHALLDECVRQIQSKRTKALDATINADKAGDDNISKDIPLPRWKSLTLCKTYRKIMVVVKMTGVNPDKEQLGRCMTRVA